MTVSDSLMSLSSPMISLLYNFLPLYFTEFIVFSVLVYKIGYESMDDCYNKTKVFITAKCL